MQSILISVISCREIQAGVFNLCVSAFGADSLLQKPNPGQFYMLRSVPSQTLLSRPISVYRYISHADGAVSLEFLILKKGLGTSELCALRSGDTVECIGPLGNGFTAPDSSTSRIALIAGGIGIAPVAGFAETLHPQSYDFYAAFRSGSYGLEHTSPANTIITTDDGSVGTKGMVSDVFTEKKAVLYTHIYACGPEPMLRYIQKICASGSVNRGQRCFLSMESRMACGVGACLGCTIRTTEGNKRCCKDGPVFSAEKVLF